MPTPDFIKLVDQCAKEAVVSSRSRSEDGTWEPLRLYYIPSEPGTQGRLILVHRNDPVPEGAVIGCHELIEGNVPFENYFNWVFERSQSLPVL